jgi:hypothetical protein
MSAKCWLLSGTFKNVTQKKYRVEEIAQNHE